ncbi:MFS transporter [Cohaesibacter gelatinilyticus]|uniref:MFS transporter, PPP family, 3-phenylpropionic acid transporter n=1 Tax=Cohaesibacter gelatinilyticus TaxID=372072 RepID=A0A285NJ20_9HYPH|nr:MFS transporter [Cohaesibacter gelatinilyticus]SNZ08913.1 MFS transporter, PPP family, 3-phenylpropionic acid transporter [Cohaesibacter gelatinilyticus]
MQMQRNSDYSWRMSVFFGGIFIPMGIYIPYFSLWLKDLGLSPQAIGLVLTIPLITRVIFTPIMGGLADKLGDRRLTLRIYSLFYFLTFAAILLSNSLVWIMMVMILSSLFQAAIVPVSDSLAMAGVRRLNLDYGRMRLWGSAAFILSNLVGGTIIATWSESSIIWMLVSGNCITALLSFLLPMDPRVEDGKTLAKTASFEWKDLKQFVQTGFWIILLATALLQASHSLLYGFGSIFWKEIGIGETQIGFLWAVSVIFEIVFFTFSKRLSIWLTWPRLLTIGAIGGIIRWGLFPLDLPVEGYFLLQILHAASFAASHLGTMFFLSEFVEDHLSGTAQGLLTMLSGLFMAAGTMIAGSLFAQWHGDAFYLMMALCLISLILIMLAKLVSIKKIGGQSSEFIEE